MVDKRLDHEHVYQLYREQGLAMRRKKRRHSASRTVTLAECQAEKQNQRWAMDFVSDTLSTGRPFRVLTIVDGCTRESPAVETDTSLPEHSRRGSRKEPSSRGSPRANTRPACGEFERTHDLPRGHALRAPDQLPDLASRDLRRTQLCRASGGELEQIRISARPLLDPDNRTLSRLQTETTRSRP